MVSNDFLENNLTTSSSLPLAVNNSNSSRSSLDKHYINILISSIVINGLVSTIATFLNCLIILTFFRTSSLRETPANVLILGLAIADFGVAIFSQPAFCIVRIANLRQDSLLFRSADTAFVASFSLFGYVSLSTYTLITVDRSIFGCSPSLAIQRAYHLSMCALNVISFFKISQVIRKHSQQIQAQQQSLQQSIDMPRYKKSVNTMYYVIVIRKHSQQIHAQQQSLQQSINMPRYKKSVNTLFYVIGSFLFSYVTMGLAFFSFLVVGYMSLEVRIMFKVANTLVLCNGLLNPIIYCWRIEDIRKAALQLVRGRENDVSQLT
ncbi:uncharacterized protein LOC116286236 [Actinia tenebrosa]|uniref:Uncharacterized protein LOC116286236 n=1 Tax=Actinia tenebrosa TaxID=6105 RepID=A0A6P8H7Z1_ACTTE|nr:uncharacterized protein LOC116286236 [Actinia tenebrosa]